MAKHKELGHYAVSSSGQTDYDDLGQIHASDQYWAEGINEILATDIPQTMHYSIETNGMSGFTDRSYYGQARNSLIVDAIDTNINVKDVWFTTIMVPETHRFYKIAPMLGLDGLCVTKAKLFVQQPLEGTPVHIDHEHQSPGTEDPNYKSLNEAFASRGEYRRIIITLQHSDPGMIFYFGNSVINNWKPGQIISWPYGMPHWMINFSDRPRYTLVITGKMPDLVKPYSKEYTIEN